MSNTPQAKIEFHNILTPLRLRKLSWLLCLGALSPLTAQADGQTFGGSKLDYSLMPHCAPEWIFEPQPLPASHTLPQVEANQLKAPHPDLLKLEGQVDLQRPNQRLSANKVRLNQKQQVAHAFGEVHFQSDAFLVKANSAYADQTQDLFRLNHIHYQLIDNRAYGTADTLALKPKAKTAQLHYATYTTCPLNTTKDGATHSAPAWELQLGRLEVDDHKRRAYGYDTWLKFQQIPIVYLPYIDFPLDDRASGFLFPTFGSYSTVTRSSLETYYSQPYYFYLAPNYDDTLTVSKLQNRGILLDNEFRYLAEKHSATLTLTGLNDQVIQQEGLSHLEGNQVIYGQNDSQRWRGKLIAQQQWAPGLTANINWQEVSDAYLYQDLPLDSTLRRVSTTSRYLRLNYRNEGFITQLSLEDNLRLGYNAPYNYEKRPGLLMSYTHPLGQSGFYYGIEAEGIEFDIKKTDHLKPEATRLYLHPSFGYQARNTWGLFEAKTQLHQVAYQMADTAYQTTPDTHYQRQVLQHQIKAGVIFERNFSLGNFGLIQTLEPTVQYLNTPYVEQYETPIFDTAKASLDFSNLFASNRFSGYDRIGDTEQISVALMSKFYTDTGRPLAETGIGQIHYLRDRQVSLSTTDPTSLSELPSEQTQTASDYFVKLGMTLEHTSLAVTTNHDYRTLDLKNLIGRLKAQPSERFLFLMTGRIQDYALPTETKEIVSGLSWQASPQWQVGAYWNYDWAADLNQKRTLAIRYDNCCWASELTLNQEEILPTLYNYGFSYMIEFKGLSTVGQPFKTFLTDKLNF